MEKFLNIDLMKFKENTCPDNLENLQSIIVTDLILRYFDYKQVELRPHPKDCQFNTPIVLNF